MQAMETVVTDEAAAAFLAASSADVTNFQTSANNKCREMILAAFSCIHGARAGWNFRQDLQDEQEFRQRLLYLVNCVNPVDILPTLSSAIHRSLQFSEYQRQIFRLIVSIQAAGIG